jgi:hypothetical protein
MSEPDATHFRVGDVWVAPGGWLHLVVSVKRDTKHRDRVLMATLRAGADGSGRMSVRRWDAIGAHTGQPWVRQI